MENNILHTRGYRFVPWDEELIQLLNLYVDKNSKGEPFPADQYPILEKQLFGDKLPWELFSETDPWQRTKDKKKTIYAFCKLTSLGKRRNSRTAGSGFWDGKTKTISIKDSRSGNTIGHKRSFTFKTKDGKLEANMGKWIIHEFSIDRTDVVLCEITTSNDVVVDHDVPSLLVVNPDGCRKRKSVENSDLDDFGVMSKKQNCQVLMMPESTGQVVIPPNSKTWVQFANEACQDPCMQEQPLLSAGYGNNIGAWNDYTWEMPEVIDSQSVPEVIDSQSQPWFSNQAYEGAFAASNLCKDSVLNQETPSSPTSVLLPGEDYGLDNVGAGCSKIASSTVEDQMPSWSDQELKELLDSISF